MAVASNRIAFVCLHKGRIIDWGIFVQPSRGKIESIGRMQSILYRLKPEIVVTEDCGAACRKGDRSRAIIASLTELASHNAVLDISIPRPRYYRSKYEESAELLNVYPELKTYAPRHKRKTGGWENKSMIIFEALALADAVYRRQTLQN